MKLSLVAFARRRLSSGDVRRIGEDVKEVCIEASYHPVRNLNGKVVKCATDLTSGKKQNAVLAGEFERNVKSWVGVSSKSALTMENAAQVFAAAAHQTNEQSLIVSLAAEELMASISDITQEVNSMAWINSWTV